MDPYPSSGMAVSPTVTFKVSKCRPEFRLFRRFSIAMRPRSLGAWEIAPIDSTRIKLFETGLRSPGGLILFSNGRITAAVLNEHNPATGVN